jgi:mannose-6-phosphate isomerase-like protein (cupin superfamily)
METDLFGAFDGGRVTANGETVELGAQAWNPHKDFEGVYLKNVVTADKTGGAFTCHLVRIDPYKKIGVHSHAKSIELHEVVSGDGTCATEKGDVAYRAGSVAVLPMNSPHEVRAGKNGLRLFAKFINVSA